MKTRMRYRLFAVLLPAILFIALLAPCAAFAADIEDTGPERGSAGERLPRFIDDVGMVTPEEAAIITAKLDDISERHGFDTVIVIVPALDGRDARLYGVDFFEQNGFGYGEELDGIILLQAPAERDFGFAVLGYGLTVFTDAGQEYLENLFLPYLSNDDYFGAYLAFADGVDDFLSKAEAGEIYDEGNIPKTQAEIKSARVMSIVASLIVAFIVAIIVVAVWVSQLKSVRRQKEAALYIRGGSMVLAESRDIFLYRHTTSVRRSSDSSGGGGGRSGGFSSSSGRSSSGRSGKY